MNILKKRIIPGIMAGILALSMAAPAFADSTTTVTGTYQPITINVDVPTTTTAAINPYGMPVDLKDGSSVLGTISGQQISTQPIYMINKTTVPLSVGATVTTTIKGGLTLVTDQTKVTGKTKASFIYLQMKQTDATNAVMTTLTGESKAEDYKLSWANDAENNSLLLKAFTSWDDGYTEGKDLVLSTSDSGVKGDDMIVLAPATKQDAGSSNPEYNMVNKGGIGIARISGILSETPTEAWSTSDGFTAKIAFTFKPANTKLTITNSTENKVVVGSTATFKFEMPEDVTADTSGITWTLASDGEDTVKITSGSTTEEVTIQGVAAGTDTLKVTFKGTNGITYNGSVTVTCTGT